MRIKEIYKNLLFLLRPSKFLFLTHTPQYFRVGQEKDGYIITKVKETIPTKITGGYVPCFEVYGKKI